MKDIASRGQTLIEVVFVIGITGLILSGFVFAVIYFNRIARGAKLRSVAVKLTQEKMEDLKAMKRNELDDFWTWAEDGYISSPEDMSDFGLIQRVFSFQNYELDGSTTPSTRKVEILVTVTWNDGSQEREFEVTSYFTDWDVDR